MAAMVGEKRLRADIGSPDGSSSDSDSDVDSGVAGPAPKRSVATDFLDRLQGLKASAGAPPRLRELINKELADVILNAKAVSEDELATLQAYVKAAKYTSTQYSRDVVYKLGKNGELHQLGRWYARGRSLQNMPRNLRNLLAGPYYVDVDMVNAQPTLLLQVCEMNGWPCEALRGYVENREALLQDVMRALSCSRDDAKEKATAIVFGSTATPPVALLPLATELRSTLLSVQAANPKAAAMLASKRGSVNLSGCVTAYVLQTIERACVDEMRASLARRGYDMGCIIHDGGLVRKHGDETELPDDILRAVEEDICASTRFRVKLLCKPMASAIELPKLPAEDYAEQKAAFEQYHWKVGDEYCIMGDGDGNGLEDGYHWVSETSMLTRYRERTLCDGKSFFHKWYTDPTMRRYASRVFWAPGCPDEDKSRNVFNTWRGFGAERLPALSDEEACDADLQAKVETVLDHIKHVICGGKADMYKWLMGFIASMLRTPGDKRQVPAVILAGEKGAGKDMFVEFLKNLVGWTLTYTTKDWDAVLGKFNMASADKVLVWVQEGKLHRREDLTESAKNRIKASKVAFEAKGRDPVNLNDCARIINTTNHFDAAPVGERDRHFCVIQVLDTHIGDSAYFSKLAACMACHRVQRKVFDFFMTAEGLLDGWRGEGYPRTDLHQELAISTAREEVHFALDWIEEHGESEEVKVIAGDFYGEYRRWCSVNRPERQMYTAKEFQSGIKNHAWLKHAMTSRKVQNNSKVQYTINLRAWRAEFAKRGYLPEPEPELPVAAAADAHAAAEAIGVELERCGDTTAQPTAAATTTAGANGGAGEAATPTLTSGSECDF